MANEWFYLSRGRVSGPHTAAELRTLAERGELTADDQVRRGQDGRWVRADTVKGLTFPPRPAAAVYTITGPDRHTGRPREVSVTAASRDEAVRMAAQAGVLTGTPHDAAVAAMSAARPPAGASGGRYPALGVISAAYQLLAFACGTAAAVGVVLGVKTAEGQSVLGAAIAAGSIVWGLLAVISLLAVSEGIRLMIDIESTLRQIRDRLPG